MPPLQTQKLSFATVLAALTKRDRCTKLKLPLENLRTKNEALKMHVRILEVRMEPLIELADTKAREARQT